MREAAAVQRELHAHKLQSTVEARRELWPAAVEEAAANMAAKFDRVVARCTALKLRAFSRARAAEREAGKSEGRLERAQAAEAQAQELSAENEEQREELQKLRARAASQPPDLSVSRVRGRFGKLPWQTRVLVWGELARRTPPSSVGPNLVDAARATRRPPGAPKCYRRAPCWSSGRRTRTAARRRPCSGRCSSPTSSTHRRRMRGA